MFHCSSRQGNNCNNEIMKYKQRALEVDALCDKGTGHL